MIEYFRLHIEYLWNAARREPPFERFGVERQGGTIDLNKTEYINYRHPMHFRLLISYLMPLQRLRRGHFFRVSSRKKLNALVAGLLQQMFDNP